MNIYRILLACLGFSIVAPTAAQVAANQIERPCLIEDLKGTWEIIRLRAPPDIDRVAHFQLLQPFQAISFGSDQSFRRMGASKHLNREDTLRVLKVSPNERFQLDRLGVISFVDQHGEVLASAGCSYFVKENPAVNIPAGTLSFLWMYKGKVIIIQAFQRLGEQ